jgi:zinc transport system permease protein
MIEILQYEFMRNAFVAAVLVSIACGIVGTYVVIKRMVFVSDGIAHAAFGGIGLGYLLEINPILAAIPFSILAALGIGTISKKTEVSEDTAIGILLTVGMALGVIFISLRPGYAPDLFSYLFGNILTVPYFDLIVMLLLDLIIILIVFLFYKEFSSMSFDEEFSTVVGMPTKILYLLLLCLVALSVVVLIRVVGIILVIALLTIPSAISRKFTHDIKKLMLLSMFTGIILTVTGLWLSYVLDLASGATIVLVLGVAFLLSSFVNLALFSQDFHSE